MFAWDNADEMAASITSLCPGPASMLKKVRGMDMQGYGTAPAAGKDKQQAPGTHMRSRFSTPLIFAGSTIVFTATSLPRHRPEVGVTAARAAVGCCDERALQCCLCARETCRLQVGVTCSHMTTHRETPCHSCPHQAAQATAARPRRSGCGPCRSRAACPRCALFVGACAQQQQPRRATRVACPSTACCVAHA